MHQLPLHFNCDADALRQYLEKKTDKGISVVVTDNSTSMLSFKNKGDSVSVRLHKIFLSAGREVLDEMAGFIKNKKGRAPLIRDFINQNSHRLKKRPPGKVAINAEGKYHDLIAAFNALNEEYFGGNISASITWGRVCSKRAARKRTLGSYSHYDKLIRINPLLDSKGVPRYFLEFIVYHEMLHEDMGAGTVNGRRAVHSREFREREKMFRHYRKALEWEKNRWG
ncbi:MAG: hypothetical protein C4526_08960 [Nitrospiraceae bacterium]|nr:MAG: hypothetical protein C4526_08960 [Nitrospiraceae bacterium]